MMAKTAHQAVTMNARFDWHKLFVLARRVILIFTLASVLILACVRINDPQSFPISKVRVQGTFTNLTETMLQSALGNIEGGYFNIDVAQLQKRVEALAWVESASVRRVWPDALLVSVNEQQALAYWLKSGLMNQRGELFYPNKNSFPQGLPQFNGAKENNILLYENYKRFNKLLNALHLTVKQIDMDARQSVIVVLSNGIKLVLGREKIFERMQQFVAIFPKLLSTGTGQIQQIDMRYTNGFTILQKNVK